MTDSEGHGVIDPRTKICTACKIEKTLDDFYVQKRKDHKDGFQARCKQCANGKRWEGGRFRNEEDKQRVYENNRKSYQKNKVKHLMRSRERSIRFKVAAIEAMPTQHCVYCTEDHPFLLEFHHRDPTEKLFNITTALQCPRKYSWEILEAELNKCDLVCVKCHALIHLSFELQRDENGKWAIVHFHGEGKGEIIVRTLSDNEIMTHKGHKELVEVRHEVRRSKALGEKYDGQRKAWSD